jgi:predicted dehydrogenase
MSLYRAAIIGCGRAVSTTAVSEGQAIAYHHASGYQAVEGVQLVAAADIDRGNLEAFAGRFGVTATYTDYRQMLEQERPDLVSICTWPGLHAEMVVSAAEAGVRGILCEKPMALGLGEADRMLAACAQHGAILYISHQRRLIRPWTIAREWLYEGKIGQLRRIDAWIENWDLLSYGTHWIDMCFYLLKDAPARWVFAQCDFTGQQRRYAHPVEDRSLTMIGFDDGVTALLHIAPEVRGAGICLVGSEGQMVIRDGMPAPQLISSHQPPAAQGDSVAFDDGYSAIIQDLMAAMKVGHGLQVEGLHGRKATEVIMAAYASSIDRQLITLPYQNPEFPLTTYFARA